MFDKLRYLSLILLLMPLAALAGGQRAITLESLNEPLNIAAYVEIIEDPMHEYTLSEIKSGQYDHLWQRPVHRTTKLLQGENDTSKTHFVGKNILSKYWFRLTFHWAGQNSENGVLYLNIQPSQLQKLAIVYPANDEAPERIVLTGANKPFGSRVLPGLQYAFPHLLKPGTTEVIGWASNEIASYPVQLPFMLLSESDFFDINQIYYGILISFYTLTLALLIYNGFLFLTLREPVYGIYLIFLTSIILTCAIIDATAARYIWPTDPLALFRAVNVTGVTSAMTYLVFISMALNGVMQWPVVKKIILTVLALGVIASIHNLVTSDYKLANAIMQIYSGLMVPLNLIIIVRSMIKRLPTAGYLFVAEIVWISGSGSFLLLLSGIFPANAFTSWGMHWGVGAEALLLSLALAARTRLLQESAIDNLKKYQTIYNNAIEGMFQYDFKGNVLKCNDSFAYLLGYDDNQSVPKDCDIFSYISEEDRNDLSSLLEEKGYLRNFEVTLANQNNAKQTWVSITMRLINGSSGKAIGSEGTVIDISERKSKEEAEAERSAALLNEEISEAKNKAKTQFFASMSHEFRTPLTAILGYTEIAENVALTEPERIAHIKTIERSAHHMLQLINDVLDLSKIEAQKMDVEEIPVNLLQLSLQIHDFIWILASQKNIAFTIKYNYPLPVSFISDPTRLKQALINLCSNSVKFTEKGGVTLSVSCDPKDEHIFFAVEDTGIGLKEDQLANLFQAFAQADKSTSRTYGGTGLGLHLSQLIANKLGGDISAESTYGKGSTFTLSISTGSLEEVSWVNERETEKELSIARELMTDNTLEPPLAEAASAVEERESGINKNKVKVLLAEDNVVNQKIMQFHIDKSGAEVVIANDGLEAIAHALLADFDLILMDMDMPRMDGMTAVRFLRNHDFSAPIVALTGNVSAESIQECKDAGCNDHLSKPLDIEKLKAIIDDIPQNLTSAKIIT